MTAHNESYSWRPYYQLMNVILTYSHMLRFYMLNSDEFFFFFLVCFKTWQSVEHHGSCYATQNSLRN